MNLMSTDICQFHNVIETWTDSEETNLGKA